MNSQRSIFLFRLAFLHYKNLYAGTRFGFFWIILGPILMLALYSLTYSVIYKVILPDYSVFQYIINVYAGIILLLTTMNTFSSASSALKRDARLRNLGLSIVDIPIKGAIIEFIPFLLSLFLLATLSIISLKSVTHLLLYLLFSCFFYLFILTLVRIISILGVLFKDIQFIIPYIGIALLLVTPISYIPSMIPDNYKILFRVNPLYYFCIAFQKISIDGSISVSLIIGIGILSVIACYLSSIFYKKSIPLILDSISQ